MPCPVWCSLEAPAYPEQRKGGQVDCFLKGTKHQTPGRKEVLRANFGEQEVGEMVIPRLRDEKEALQLCPET